ncbi:MAG TPA: DUF6378 domain-containing protein [Gammaproteobacteria bacterium]|jgi:hypothetical protein|nr:DUF6378 domain-containing protein [Gammaproteobacteria bacterium]
MLQEAQKIVNGQRREDYGDIEASFCRVARLWSAYLDFGIDKYDVAKMMILLKVSRAKDNNHRDSFVDIAGYIECIDLLLNRENDA